MFGGVLTLVLVVVMRVLVTRQWRAGIGLDPRRRLLLPAIALVIGLLGLRRGGSQVFAGHLAALIGVALVVTVVGGLVRAATVTYAKVPETDLYPGGLRVRARTATVVADVVALAVAALTILPAVASKAGLHPAAGALIAVVAIGDVVASGVLILRGRAAGVAA